MSTAHNAQITVVYPMIDLRGQAADRVRTWTHGQTLARGRFRVVVASDCASPSQEQEVAALLGPHDELLRVPGAGDADLWNAGAARAGTPWLVFTEGHCLAEPGCLEAVARWNDANPAAEAGNFAVNHYDSYRLARLSRRWFDTILARWDAPGEWPRVHRAGFAIRAGVFAAVGGFEADYGQFAPPLLSARLHARGYRVETVPDAAVLHQDDERMREHHFDSADHARGELDARSRNEAMFFERYFGHGALWTNQLREQPRVALGMARAVLAAAVAHPLRIAKLAAQFHPSSMALVAGIAPRVALLRFAVALDEFIIDRMPLPAQWRWRLFLRAHDRVVRLAQLEWLHRQPRFGALPLPPGRWPIERIGPGALTGAHGLEENNGRRFRWTEPVALMHLAPSDGELEIRIETAGIRGDPLAAVIAVVAGGKALPRELLASEGDGTLVIRMPAPWSSAARKGIYLVCSALSPARNGSPDQRLLGLPVVSITSAPPHRAQTRLPLDPANGGPILPMKTVIVGLGKTGTTALFFKLKRALPDDTCCLFEPRFFQATAGRAVHVLAKVLIGYHRDVDIAGLETFNKKIFLLRDPRDTLVSRVLYDIYNEAALCADGAKVGAFVNLLRRKEADPSRTPLLDIIALFDGMSRRPMLPRATRDAGVALEFERRHADFLPYRYEDLVRADFKAIESYLGYAVGQGAASVPAEYSRVARTKGCGDWRNWLTPRDVDFFRPYFMPYLAFNSYADDWTLPDRPRILPEHGSEYVLRLVDERRRLTPPS